MEHLTLCFWLTLGVSHKGKFNLLSEKKTSVGRNLLAFSLGKKLFCLPSF